MCFPVDAVPPIPAIAGAAVDSEDLVLKASDGNELAAFVARAEKPNGAGMVVLPDVRGLFSFYEELALRFAEVGINSVAIDYFGRTAGVSKRNDPAFEFMPHVMKTTPDGITADTAAAVAYLRSPAGGSLHVGVHGRLLLRRLELVGPGRGRASSLRRHRLLRPPPPRTRQHPQDDSTRRPRWNAR